MTNPQTVDTKNVRYVKARDGRVVAIVVRSDFDEYDQFPPVEDKASTSPRVVRAPKAQLTPDEWPLQVVLIRGEPEAVTKPHYHRVERSPTVPTRHQVLCCRTGAVRVGVFGTDGEYVEDVILRAGDMILLGEGHAVQYLEPDARVLEIKQGPYPGTDEADMQELGVSWR